MADVKICDRCGNRVESGMFPITLEPVRYILGTETRVAVWGGMKNVCSEYDLCKECMDDLVKFLEGKTEGSTEKK